MKQLHRLILCNEARWICTIVLCVGLLWLGAGFTKASALDVCGRTLPVCATLLGFILTNLNLALSQMKTERMAVIAEAGLSSQLLKVFRTALASLGWVCLICAAVIVLYSFRANAVDEVCIQDQLALSLYAGFALWGVFRVCEVFVLVVRVIDILGINFDPPKTS